MQFMLACLCVFLNKRVNLVPSDTTPARNQSIAWGCHLGGPHTWPCRLRVRLRHEFRLSSNSTVLNIAPKFDVVRRLWLVPDSAVDDLSLANIGVVGDIAVNSGPLVVGRPLSLLMDSKGITGISERNPAELVCLISCLLPYLHSRLALILVARHRINTECAQVLLVSINLNEEGAVFSCSRVDKDSIRVLVNLVVWISLWLLWHWVYGHLSSFLFSSNFICETVYVSNLNYNSLSF